MSDLIFYRNAVAVFNVGFFADIAKTTPIVPINSDYPRYTILDPGGMEILNGVGSPGVGSGYWQAQLTFDNNLELTTPEMRYTIKWTMVNALNQQYDYSEQFELFDAVVSEPEDREQKYVVMAGGDAGIKITLDHIPFSLSAAVYQGTDQSNPIITIPQGALTRINNGNLYTFTATIPANLLLVNYKYSIIWKIRRSATDNEQYAFQSMSAIGAYTLALITSVRMLIDKFQKRIGTVQAYEDSDIVEYLERGAELLNAHYPITYFNVGTMPPALNTHHIMLASWYALNAQQILEIDLGFNFSGQRVTLDYDHASQLSDVLGRWKDFIDGSLSSAKLSILNATGSVGTSAGRGYRFTQNLTWRVASLGTTGQVTSGSIIGQMNTLGLLW